MYSMSLFYYCERVATRRLLRRKLRQAIRDKYLHIVVVRINMSRVLSDGELPAFFCPDSRLSSYAKSVSICCSHQAV